MPLSIIRLGYQWKLGQYKKKIFQNMCWFWSKAIRSCQKINSWAFWSLSITNLPVIWSSIRIPKNNWKIKAKIKEWISPSIFSKFETKVYIKFQSILAWGIYIRLKCNLFLLKQTSHSRHSLMIYIINFNYLNIEWFTVINTYTISLANAWMISKN